MIGPSIQLLLAGIALIAQVANAQYGNVARNGNAFSHGTVSSSGGNQLILTAELSELKGVWKNVGSQQPESVYVATENRTMPDCSSENGEYSYRGLDTTAEQYTVLAGTTGVNRMVINQQRSTFSPNVTYTNGLILADNRGTVTCTHFKPFVDLTTGELMAESLAMTQLTVNASSSSPTRTSINCQIKGNELPGCYTGEVQTNGAATAPSASSPTASSPTVAIASISMPPMAARPSGSIITVTRTTYQCGNGECLRLSPKYASSSPVYGG